MLYNKAIRPPIIIYNVPLPYKIEEDFILNWFWIEQYLPYLIEAGLSLEKAWADFIVIPCNSVHILIDKLREKYQFLFWV